MKLIALFASVVLFSCAPKKIPRSEVFIDLMNSYNADSLRGILASDFQLTRTYTAYKNDRESFLGEYLTRSKLYKAKFLVTDILSSAEPRKYLVKDESIYLKYLDVSPYTWQMIIKRNSQNKIELVNFDTSGTFTKYVSEVKTKEVLFEKWLKSEYPEETLEKLRSNESLMFERLEKYSTSK